MDNRLNTLKRMQDKYGTPLEVVSSFIARSLTVGATAVQLSTTSKPAGIGVLIKAGANNSGFIYVGEAATVTALGTDADTDGFELDAGESVLIPVDDANKIYVIGSDADQVVSFEVA